MRLSHNGYLEIMLTHNETRPIGVGVCNPDCACHVISAEFHISRTRNFSYARFCQAFKRSNNCELMSAHDEALSVAMYVLLLLLVVVENGYDP